MAEPTETPDTTTPADHDAEKFAALKRELQVGLDDLAAGRIKPGEEVFARLKSRFPS